MAVKDQGEQKRLLLYVGQDVTTPSPLRPAIQESKLGSRVYASVEIILWVGNISVPHIGSIGRMAGTIGNVKRPGRQK